MSTMLTLSDEQTKAKEAIRAYLRGPSLDPFVLNGLAGTGKTTVLSQIAREYPQAHLCTLTGKAASILRRKTGLPACTIHSAFYRLLEVEKDQRGRAVPKFTPVHKVGGELKGKIVLIDECSMINHGLARDIINTGAKIVACGDPGQLPPVSGEQFFARADFTLKTIHRQALESPIIRQAYRIRSGENYEADGDKFQIRAGEVTDEDCLNAEVILCYTNKTRHRANQHARSIRGIWQTAPREGEPIVCLKNVADYGIYNGATYILEQNFREGDTKIHTSTPKGASSRYRTSPLKGCAAA